MVVVAGADIAVQADLGQAPFILNRDHLTVDVLTAPDDAWDDVTCDVARGSWAWGASQPLGPLTTVAGGRASLELVDPLRIFDPSNDASALVNVLRIGTPLRVTADGIPIWTGTLEAWRHDLGSAASTLEGIDALAALAALVLPPGTAIPAGWSTAQLAAILTAAAWPASRRVVYGTPGAYRSAVVVEGSAAGAADTVRLAELGDLWADRSGRLAFRGRGDPYAPPPAAIVNCGGAALGSLASVFTRDRVRNRIEVDGNTPPVFLDSSSVSRHGPRTFSSSVGDLALVNPPAGGFLELSGRPVAAPRTIPASLAATLSSPFMSPNLGGGGDAHIPVGTWGGNGFNSGIRFPTIDWSGVAGVTKAILRLRTTGQVHVGFGSSPRITARRITASWTPNSGGENTWTSSGQGYPGPAATTAGQVTVGTTKAEETLVDVDITAIVKAWAPASAGGSGAGQYGILLVPGAAGDTTDTIEFYSARASGKQPLLIITAVTNHPPNAPVPVAPVGPGAAVSAGFQATATDPEGDAIVAYTVELHDVAGALVWTVVGGSAGIAGGSIVVPYTGPALVLGASYSWRMQCKDTPGGWGAWSAPAPFTFGTAPPDPITRWASTILGELAEPVPLSVLGTITPRDDDVAGILGAEYGDRLEVVDVHTSPPIDRLVRILGMSVELGPDRISASAVTEDV